MRAIPLNFAFLVLFGFLNAFYPAASAQQPTAAGAAQPATPETQLQAAFEAAKAVVVRGPVDVLLLDQATLHIPADYAFVPSKEARAILKAMGNRTDDDMLGMIFPTSDRNSNWFVAIQYEKVGYIKDDDAKDWNADELLTNVRDCTEEANKERKARGIPELQVTGWVERPQYDATTHQLRWSISSTEKGASEAAKGINYNTYSLGREGFITMNLVTDLASVELQKPGREAACRPQLQQW